MNIFNFARKKEATPPIKESPRKLISSVVRQAEYQTRKDIADWQSAVNEAKGTYSKRQTRLQRIYENALTDALLSSQMGLRIDKTQSTPFHVVGTDGKPNEDAERLLADNLLFDSLSEAIIGSKMFGHSLVEFSFQDGKMSASVLPRAHVYPAEGIFYPDLLSNQEVRYREAAEYGKWYVEFGSRSADDLGLLNGVVPHVLMKRSAQSCWSELCELYGIPPMVIKTNTQDPEMVARIKEMFAGQGSNSKFLTDTTEEVEWATGVATNGDVFRNLISLCNSEISMSVCGAILGQDTVNGNRSKEESSSRLLDSIVSADQRYVEANFNHAVLPALAAIGYLPQGLRLSFAKEVDLSNLWDMTAQALPYYEVNPQWIKDTFGIDVTGTKQQQQALAHNPQADFFA